MATPRISIVMPVFNAAATLDEAVTSILQQQYEDWELIVVEDGSTDDSPDLLRRHAARDSRIRMISQEHGGIVTALRQGCAQARGHFIARMDADDISLPERLAEQVRLLENATGPALCGACAKTVGAAAGSGRLRYESWINNLIHHENIVRELFVECPLPHPTFMLPRGLYEHLGGYRETNWPEDYDLVMRAWMAGARFCKPEGVLLHWREHPLRLSMNDPRYSPEAFRRGKRHFLYETFLKGAGAFIQWGAGEVGKKWLREWPSPPMAAVDINPRKIGRKIHGVPIIPPEALPPPGTSFIVIAVGAPGARDEIRDRLNPRGYREMTHYLFLA